MAFSKCRFAGTVWTGDEKRLSFSKRNAHLAQRSKLAIANGDVLDIEEGHRTVPAASACVPI